MFTGDLGLDMQVLECCFGFSDLYACITAGSKHILVRDLFVDLVNLRGMILFIVIED